MKIPADVMTALTERAKTDGPRLVLTGPRFEPRLYQRVNEVLEAVGGRWAKSEQAHVFAIDAADAIAPALATGHVVTLREKLQQAQYFPTPAPVVNRLLELADLAAGMEVLEPSAGSGAIATALAERGVAVDCVERDPGYAALLTETGIARTVRVADFLTLPPEARFDRVVMNPPFTRGADITHVQHALRFLKPDGLLVSVMSHATTFQNGPAAKFRNLAEQRGGQVEALPEKAFAESGTDTRTIVVAIPATRPAVVQPVVWPETAAAPTAEPKDYGDPAEIAREIADNLRDALSIMDGLARDLARPIPTAPQTAAETVNLPPPDELEQLAFLEEGDAA